MIKLDTEDESLQRYKKALLGDIDESALKGTEGKINFYLIKMIAPEVEFI